jgi:hypothetical protein
MPMPRNGKTQKKQLKNKMTPVTLSAGAKHSAGRLVIAVRFWATIGQSSCLGREMA